MRDLIAYNVTQTKAAQAASRSEQQEKERQSTRVKLAQLWQVFKEKPDEKIIKRQTQGLAEAGGQKQTNLVFSEETVSLYLRLDNINPTELKGIGRISVQCELMY